MCQYVLGKCLWWIAFIGLCVSFKVLPLGSIDRYHSNNSHRSLIKSPMNKHCGHIIFPVHGIITQYFKETMLNCDNYPVHTSLRKISIIHAVHVRNVSISIWNIIRTTEAYLGKSSAILFIKTFRFFRRTKKWWGFILPPTRDRIKWKGKISFSKEVEMPKGFILIYMSLHVFGNVIFHIIRSKLLKI